MDPRRLCSDCSAARIGRQRHRILAVLGWIRWLEADDLRGAETALHVLTTSMHRHFANGEDLLAGNGYPCVDGRGSEHQRCLAELRGYRERLDEGRSDGMIAALERIGSWFAQHLEDDEARGQWHSTAAERPARHRALLCVGSTRPARAAAARAGG
jgi:hemerythrin